MVVTRGTSPSLLPRFKDIFLHAPLRHELRVVVKKERCSRDDAGEDVDSFALQQGNVEGKLGVDRVG